MLGVSNSEISIFKLDQSQKNQIKTLLKSVESSCKNSKSNSSDEEVKIPQFYREVTIEREDIETNRDGENDEDNLQSCKTVFTFNGNTANTNKKNEK